MRDARTATGRRPWRNPTVVVGLLLVIASAGCGDEPRDGDDGQVTADVATPTPADDEGNDADADELLGGFMDRQPEAVQVTYELDGPPPMEDGQMTIASDPPNHVTVMDTPQGEVRTFAGEVNAVCMQQGGQWQCMETADDDMPGMADDPMDQVPTWEEVEEELDADMSPSAAWTETIADRSATCFEFEEVAGMEETEVCLDDDTGAMLRSVSPGPDGGEPIRLEAVEVDDDPDPELFELPAEPTPMDG